MPGLDVSAAWLARQRWFGGKDRAVGRIEVVDQAALTADATWLLLRVTDEGGVARTYSLLRCNDDGADALAHPPSLDALRLGFEGQASLPTAAGSVRFHTLGELGAAGPARSLDADQTNSAVAYGRELLLKWLRAVEPGPHPDLEMGRFLANVAGFESIPPPLGWLSYEAAGQEPVVLAVLQRFVPNHGNGWEALLGQLPNGGVLETVHQLGQLTGRMHQALTSHPELPAFAPEAVSEDDITRWVADVREQLRQAGYADQLAGLERLRLSPQGVSKLRIHGDYHLGQLLRTDGGFAVIDFEGEPTRPLAARSAKQPALRDVASMLRSLHYAAWSTTLSGQADEDWAAGWIPHAWEAFLRGWRSIASTSGVLLAPDSERLLRLFLLSKAAYELNYERGHRPDWAGIAQRGIAELMRDLLRD